MPVSVPKRNLHRSCLNFSAVPVPCPGLKRVDPVPSDIRGGGNTHLATESASVIKAVKVICCTGEFIRQVYHDIPGISSRKLGTVESVDIKWDGRRKAVSIRAQCKWAPFTLNGHFQSPGIFRAPSVGRGHVLERARILVAIAQPDSV